MLHTTRYGVDCGRLSAVAVNGGQGACESDIHNEAGSAGGGQRTALNAAEPGTSGACFSKICLPAALIAVWAVYLLPFSSWLRPLHSLIVPTGCQA